MQIEKIKYNVWSKNKVFCYGSYNNYHNYIETYVYSGSGGWSETLKGAKGHLEMVQAHIQRSLSNNGPLFLYIKNMVIPYTPDMQPIILKTTSYYEHTEVPNFEIEKLHMIDTIKTAVSQAPDKMIQQIFKKLQNIKPENS